MNLWHKEWEDTQQDGRYVDLVKAVLGLDVLQRPPEGQGEKEIAEDTVCTWLYLQNSTMRIPSNYTYGQWFKLVSDA